MRFIAVFDLQHPARHTSEITQINRIFRIICRFRATVRRNRSSQMFFRLTLKTTVGIFLRMKRRQTYLDLLARRALAIIFACLFIVQAVGLLHVRAAAASPTQNGAIAEMARGALVGEHCSKLASDQGPVKGQCDHAGLCAFCSFGDRETALLESPPSSSLIAILAPEDEPARRFARSVERATPLPSSSGLDESRFATAPPRA